MDQFLTFDRYQELKGTLNEIDFTQYELLARMKINELTNNRLLNLEDDDPLWEKIEMLTFMIIRQRLLGDLDGKDYQSESAGNRSITHLSKDGRVDALVKQFLPDYFSGGIISVGILRT